MKVYGLPENFWVVSYPASDSELDDCCFESDFQRFALQIRGGLDERRIVGIFAVESEAVEVATSLLQTIKQPPAKSDLLFHKSPWSWWYATQESAASVTLCNKATGQSIVVEPPKDWGRNWSWNISPDGTGIVMHRTL